VTDKKTLISAGTSTSLLFPVTKPYPSSIKKDNSTWDIQYTVLRELQMAVTLGAGTVTATGGIIQPIEVGSFVAIGESGPIPNNYFSLDVTGKVITTSSCPQDGVVKIYCTFLKQNIGDNSATPKTKTVATSTEVFKYFANATAYSLNDKVWYGNNLYTVTVAGTTHASTVPTHTSGSVANGGATLTYASSMLQITLAHTDLISITSIIDSVGDITYNYSMNDGQDDYSYKRGSIVKLPGKTNPTGNFTVIYTYYQHSDTGDFFCVNSYPTGFLDQGKTYTSKTTGKIYTLASYLDFRPSVGIDGLLNGTGAKRNDLIVSGTTFFTTLHYYVPRIDSLVINSQGNLSVISGIPAETPAVPKIPTGQLELNRFYIPAYTSSSNAVEVKRMDVQRFTMRDIKEIVTRVENLEDFSTLTASESAINNYEIKDASTGLNRFKSGYLVESFKNPFTIARTTAADYSATFVGECLAAPVEELICDMILTNDETTATSFVIKNGCLMLPYTEVQFARQPLSSRVTNLNPFAIFAWNGLLYCNPPADQWVETLNLPTIFEYRAETVTIDWAGSVVGYDTTPTYRNNIVPAAKITVTPAPVNLILYKVTLPNGRSYTTVGSPGTYDTNEEPGTVQVLGSAQVQQSGSSTLNAVRQAATRLGGQGVQITDDVYKQIAYTTTGPTTDALNRRIG
jgi:hypothetical protein